jgi:ribosomal-protein-alanine N-acetyltransferase
MIQYQMYTPQQLPDAGKINNISAFLFQHLDEYGDPEQDIRKAINYALGATPGVPGGVVLTADENGQLCGAVVINHTGMGGYIPEHILVYIATHKSYRGKGIGRQLMQKAIEVCEGAVALHVEADNPARGLYEQLGFTNKYLEMRLTK